jgi:hypothetical protein
MRTNRMCETIEGHQAGYDWWSGRLLIGQDVVDGVAGSDTGA